MPYRATASASSLQSHIETLEQRTLLSALPAGFSDTTLASGLTSPSSMEFLPDGRLLVSQQPGQILMVKNGKMLATPFATLSDTDDYYERGLLGVTVDPNFATNHYVYAFYTTLNPVSHNRIVRFTANGDVALAGSEKDIFDLPAVGSAIWHMGGAIHFGPDGKLYVSVGDYQQPNSAQDLSVLTGKILRINSDGSIPSDDPFYKTQTGNSRAIWAYGLRNPFTSAFEPGTGVFYINNVGENTWETLYQGKAGANYGWPTVEGPRTGTAFAQPIYLYQHDASGGCIVGGGFYDAVAQQFPASYAHQYFFADFAQGWLKTLNPTTHAVSNFATGLSFPTAVRVGPDGGIWVLTRGGPTVGLRPGLGQLHEIKYAAAPAPVTIKGNVTNDLNKNGVWDNGDRRLSGWTVYLDANNNGKLDAGELHSTTDINGAFGFWKLSAGTYVVRVIAPTGWQATNPKSNSFSLTAATGQTKSLVFSETRI
jgi:glucose/arabinose dehydrogenase